RLRADAAKQIPAGDSQTAAGTMRRRLKFMPGHGCRHIRKFRRYLVTNANFSRQTPVGREHVLIRKRNESVMFPFAWLKTIETLAPIVYVLLAALVTVYVLLKKSDVRAALGWIAAAWLSPIFGSLLYYMFGINRVTRRGARLRRQGESPGPR